MLSVEVLDEKLLPEHHIQQEFCTTRPLYRKGRKLTAVKVFTINNESQHLIIYRVPQIKLFNEIKAVCEKYGEVKKMVMLSNYKTEIFTECFHVHYARIQSARIAKRVLDNKSFYGEILHVCYAPEFETLAETREKLRQRNKDVVCRLAPGPTALEYANTPQGGAQHPGNRKRKYPALPLTEERLKNLNEDQIWTGIPVELDPRTKTSTDSHIKKHFQVSSKNELEIRPQIGPQVFPESSGTDISLPQSCEQPKIQIDLPLTDVKNIKSGPKKRIVFRNKPNVS